MKPELWRWRIRNVVALHAAEQDFAAGIACAPPRVVARVAAAVI